MRALGRLRSAAVGFGLVGAVLAVALLAPPGCDRSNSGGSGNAKSGGGDKPKIAVIPKGTSHEFWKTVHAGANKAGEEFNVEVIWKGPMREDDRANQIETIENFVSRGVQGIALAPLDDTAMVAPVAAAQRQNIPVVIFDSGLKSEDYVSFVATDNYKGGVLAGEKLAELLGGKGRVVLLRYAPGSASTIERENGFLEAIKKHPDLKVVSENQYAGATRETAFQASENLLAPLNSPSGLAADGIFCPNETSTAGMLKALENVGAAGKVKFVGFDAATDLVEAMKAGKIHALISQNPFKMGYEAVKAMVDKLQGRPVPKRVDTGVEVITPQNLEDPKIKELLTPDLKKWLRE
jgi:ribose transport system substrate-binding protein